LERIVQSQESAEEKWQILSMHVSRKFL